MKKPNFKKWVGRETERIRSDISNLNVGDAYYKTVRLERNLGEEYFGRGEIAKANP